MTDTNTYCIWRRQITVGVRTVVQSRLEHYIHLRAMGVITHLPTDLRKGKPVRSAAPYSGSTNRNHIRFGWYRDHQGATRTVITYGKGD